MPDYVLRGVLVTFPYDAYPVQLDYMTSVIAALQNSEHALLESPTGTGKTLCLLCATLAWRRSLVTEMEAALARLRADPHSSELVQGIRVGLAQDAVDAMRAGGFRRGLGAANQQGGGRAGGGRGGGGGGGGPPNPTGPGSLPSGTAPAGGAGASPPTVVYSSRTHSQLAQVASELRRAGYRVRSAVLAGRQQACLHPRVSSLSGAASNRACRQLMARRSCSFQLGVEPFERAHPDAGYEVMDLEDLRKLGRERTVCPYLLARDLAGDAEIVLVPYAYLVDGPKRRGLQIEWNNSVLVFDEAHNLEGVCAEAASFDLPALALAGAIEELGEASEAALRAAEGAGGAGPGSGAGQGGRGNPGGADPQEMLRLSAESRQARLVLLRLEQEISRLECHPQLGATHPGGFILQLFARVGLTEQTWPVLSTALEAALDALTDEAAAAGRASASRASSFRLAHVIECLATAFAAAYDEEAGEAGGGGAGARAARGATPMLTLSLWCFSPGVAMRRLERLGARSVVLTSGTLAPLGSFAAELALRFPHRLENPHVVSDDRVLAAVVPVGPGGRQLNSSYQRRDDPAYLADLGAAIINACRVVPGGVLVFFPSYSVLRDTVQAWKGESWGRAGAGGAPGGGGGGGGRGGFPPGGVSSAAASSTLGQVWNRLQKLKPCVVEQRDASTFADMVTDFRQKIASAGGCVLFAVCRGKASEGIDFADESCRLVIMTGIPYATKTDAKVRIKQGVLDEGCREASAKRTRGGSGALGPPGPAGGAPQDPPLSGSAWYSQTALRAVNQAIGRVIRHRNDYGAVLFLDDRYRSPHVRGQLSRWLRDRVTCHDRFGPALGELSAFFKRQASREASEKAAGAVAVESGGTAAAAAAAAAPGTGETAVPGRLGAPGPTGFHPASVSPFGLVGAATFGVGAAAFAASLPAAVDVAGLAAGATAGGGGDGERKPVFSSLLKTLEVAGGGGSGEGASENPVASRNPSLDQLGAPVSGQAPVSRGKPPSPGPLVAGEELPSPSPPSQTPSQPVSGRSKPWERRGTRPTAGRAAPAPELAAMSQDAGGEPGRAGAGPGESCAGVNAWVAADGSNGTAAAADGSNDVGAAADGSGSSGAAAACSADVGAPSTSLSVARAMTDGAARGSPASAKGQRDAFFVACKATLGEAELRGVGGALRRYARDKDRVKLIEDVFARLRSHPELARMFLPFLPEEGRVEWREREAGEKRRGGTTPASRGGGGTRTETPNRTGASGEIGRAQGGLDDETLLAPLPGREPPKPLTRDRLLLERNERLREEGRAWSGKLAPGEPAWRPGAGGGEDREVWTAGRPSPTPGSRGAWSAHDGARVPPGAGTAGAATSRGPLKARPLATMRGDARSVARATAVPSEPPRGGAALPTAPAAAAPARPAARALAPVPPATAPGARARPLVARPRGPLRNPCPICRQAERSLRSPCGHVACSGCWTKACALMKCTVCGKAVRRSQLRAV